MSTVQKNLKLECDNLRATQESNAALIARLEADLEVKLLRADRTSRFGGGASAGPVSRGGLTALHTM